MTLQELYEAADMNPAALFALVTGLLPADAPAPAAAGAAATVEVRFDSDDAKHKVPGPYQLAPHSFPVTTRLRHDLVRSGVEVYEVTFPSACVTPFECNNPVHAEYFKPKNPGKFPAVIVLDILQGNALVSRGAAMWLAMHDIPALAVTMPFYGPRRPTEGRHRLLSTDVSSSLANVRQTVLDCRRATAWLMTQPEVDPARLGVVGTSLGSFLGGLLAASEPNIHSACLLLGGGGLVDAFADHPQARLALEALKFIGVGKEQLKRMIAPADPLTYADRLKEKRLLLIAASRDDVVPPSAMKRLWEATGKPRIVWFDSTHVGAAAYAFPAMNAVIEHLKE